jgi:thiamine pyrophosphokinase
LQHIKITANIIIGDLDSVDKKNITHKTKIIYLPKQDKSDLEKTLEYAKKSNLLPAIIIGFNGDCLAHNLYNISLLSKYDNNVLLDEESYSFFITRNIKLNLPINTKVSFFGINKAVISTQGFKWNIASKQLNFFDFNSLSNQTNNYQQYIKIEKGKILVVINSSFDFK